VRIATYNVNGVNGRLPRLLEWLAETAPDVACLQELKTDDSKFPIGAIEAAGYGAVWHGQRSHHGVAILARGRQPAERRRGMPGDASDVATRYLEADVEGLVVSSVYLPNGNPVPSANFDYKLRWFARFLRHAKRLRDSRAPVVLAGDLNVVPTDFDIANPGWWRFDAVMQPEPRQAYAKLLAQGWVDSARKLEPKERLFTYFTTADAYRRGKGMRLDFLLVDPALSRRLRATGVDGAFRIRDKPSDHAPAWITIDR
jgi:exodeoxyribonuclease-3